RDLDLLFAFPEESRVEGWRLGSGEVSINRPVFFLVESFDFTLALDDQPQRNGLDTAGGEPAANLIPKQRRNLVANQAVEHTPGLLGVHELLINIPGMFKL